MNGPDPMMEHLICKAREKDMSEKEDMVNSPSHYNNGGIECIDAIRSMLGEEGFVSYCKGNALKYHGDLDSSSTPTRTC
ncbi:hypothetical protein LCGC14_2605360 [marine sediment metagenome]|uniref:Uncharacterized protein n=1 Tax=marine sediment metagenome TaxID=412755 RepID=A0A0F9A7F5_9ZZZZ